MFTDALLIGAGAVVFLDLGKNLTNRQWASARFQGLSAAIVLGLAVALKVSVIATIGAWGFAHIFHALHRWFLTTADINRLNLVMSNRDVQRLNRSDLF